MSTAARLAVLALVFAGTGALLTETAEARRGPDRPKLVELGRRLFFDAAASRAGKFSCASCHDPEHGFSDPRVHSEDENGETRRHSQPLTDLVDGRGMHWDGEFDTVRELLTARLEDPRSALASLRGIRRRHYERARKRGDQPDKSEFRRTMSSLTPPYYGPMEPRRPTVKPLEERLDDDGRYERAFSRVFGSSRVTTERVIDALEAYVLSLRTTKNAYDRFLAGDPGALDAQQRRGLRLFSGKANCASCHTLEAGRPLLTDGAYHNTGVAFRNLSLAVGGATKADGGHGEMTFVDKDMGRFKTPGLRDVARRAPYMHDGSLKTLEEVVRYYDRGGTPNRYLDRDIAPLDLDEGEVEDLVAFLHALTGDRRAGLGDVPSYRRHATVTIVDPAGRPLPGLAVAVRPFGDRLGDARRVAPFRVETDRHGRVSFDYPPSTHVVLDAPDHEIDGGRPLPDTLAKAELVALPKDRIAVRIRYAEGKRNLPKTVTAYRVEDRQVVALFRRVRKLSAREGYYVAGRSRDDGVATVRFDCQEKGARALFFELDLSGGESAPITIPQ